MTGAELRAARKEQGLTQKQLGDRWGCHWVTISDWERERHPIPRWVEDATKGLERAA